MKVSNKKIVVVVLLIIELTSCYLMYQSSKKEVNLDKVSYQENIPNNLFAMYIKNEETGEYDEITDTNIFPDGYKLNSTKTGCIDNKGNSVENILNYKNGKVAVKSNKTVFCYLYFDIDKSVYQKVRSDYKNSNGALLLSETESDEYPVYYYNGNITNNNILYANFCWKMVRTTETGGVKLIYNGIPDESEDGTLTCDNTGDESQIGKSTFNPQDSLARVGYMYNEIYKFFSKGAAAIALYTNIWSHGLYFFYGDKAVWNEETQQYDLKLSDGTDVTETTIWSTDLVGKYTCRNTTDTSCKIVSYVVSGNKNYMYYYELSDGKAKDDYKIKLATSVTDNGDGTYTLADSLEISKADWPTTHSNYVNYYYCNDLTSETCGANNTIMYYSTSTSTTSLAGLNRDDYKYGNSFTYENGVYTLKDTKEFWDWSTNYNQINNNHYTCFNTTGECENVHYIYYTDASIAYYITLSDGKSVEEAINEMLYADDVNTTDSTIKKYIDEWYKEAILNKTNEEGLLYSSYLENTIWCNSREISDLGGWNPNGGRTSTGLYFNYYSLDCANKTDQFTLKVEAGGTEEYGNNALDYPVGLLTRKEVELATENGYLKSGNNYWLLSPKYYFSWAIYGNLNVYNFASNYVNYSYGVRPSVSLGMSVEIKSGNGEVNNPYQVTLSS